MTKLKDKPFVLLGVNTDGKRATARRAVTRNKLLHRSWWDRSPSGPICTRWCIVGFPTFYVLDPTGKVYARASSCEIAADLVTRLLYGEK